MELIVTKGDRTYMKLDIPTLVCMLFMRENFSLAMPYEVTVRLSDGQMETQVVEEEPEEQERDDHDK